MNESIVGTDRGTIRRAKPAGNHYLLNPKEQWAAVLIAGNADTSLEDQALASAGDVHRPSHPDAANHGMPDDMRPVRDVSAGRPRGFFCFAVWRHPVDRFVEIYARHALDAVRHPRLDRLRDSRFDDWIDFARDELQQPPLKQIPELRMQANHFSHHDVDRVAHFDHLREWFGTNGWRPPRDIRSARAGFLISPRQRRRVERLYRRDLELLDTMRNLLVEAHQWPEGG